MVGQAGIEPATCAFEQDAINLRCRQYKKLVIQKINTLATSDNDLPHIFGLTFPVCYTKANEVDSCAVWDRS